MAKILFITGNYYPSFSPNGSVVKNLIDELKLKNDVSVLSTKSKFEYSKVDFFEGYTIYRVDNIFSMIHNYLNDKIINSSTKLGKKFFYYLLQIKRIVFKLYKIFGKSSLNNILIKKQLKEIQKIKEIFQFDIIIPISMPIESIASAIEYKMKYDPNLKIIPYQIDHFSDSQTLHGDNLFKKLKFNHHLMLEEKYIEQSYHYFIFPQIDSHINKHKNLKRFKTKIEVTEHPLLTNKNTFKSRKKIIFKNNKINLLFSGMLNKNIRNPKYLLDLFSLIPLDKNICLNFFHVGDCNEIINTYEKKLTNNLNNMESVSLEKSFKGMSEANILISLGVTSGNQVSGKIFDYFSFGKPIIHFYYFDEDPNLKYLERYPLSLCIKINSESLQDISDKVIDFCLKYSEAEISYEDVEELFKEATPRYVASKFEQIIKNINDNILLN